MSASGHSANSMHIDRYEKAWIAVAGLMIVAFLGAMTFAGVMHGVHPPSHMETIDPLTARTSSEFASPGVATDADGSVTVTMLIEMFRFLPSEIRVPAGVPVRFRMTTPDVLHGFQIVGTNANALVVPGYISDFSVTFPTPGEYLILCNEYCGTSHHLMQGKLIVEATGANP